MVEISDAVYIRSNPILHYKQVKYALEKGKHVLCEAPIALKTEECRELFQLAKKNRCTLVEGLRQHILQHITDLSYLLRLEKSEK